MKGASSRRQFDKLDNKEIALHSIMDNKDQGITTTIVADNSGASSGRNSKEDVMADTDSEQNIIIQKEQRHIRQWTNITRTVEMENGDGNSTIILQDEGRRF